MDNDIAEWQNTWVDEEPKMMAKCCEDKCDGPCPPEPVILKRPDGSTFEKPTFQTFLDHGQVMTLLHDSHTKATWDFNTALGDTIREKYEALYLKLCEMTNVLIGKGTAGYFWIVASPEITSIFETGYGFSPSAYCSGYYGENLPVPQGIEGVSYCGIANGKWRIYKDFTMPKDQVLIGANDQIEAPKYYGTLNIENFII